MSLLSELGSMFSGQEGQRIAQGHGNYQSPESPDTQRAQTMVSQADPQQVQQVFTQAIGAAILAHHFMKKFEH